MKKLVSLSILIAVIAVSCEKEATLSVVPKIDLTQAGPSVIEENVDSVYFEISYTDADGDLGSTDPNVRNLFVEDTRIGLVYKYRIQELVPNGATVGIEGELHFSIPNTVITDGSKQQEVIYSIWVKDMAGHESNRLSVGPFLVIE